MVNSIGATIAGVGTVPNERSGMRETSTITVGRPVRFAGGNPDEALAMQRYRAAFERLGAGHARYVYEPVGAAFSFARRLERDATVLVADFGGGTSDFSLLRVGLMFFLADVGSDERRGYAVILSIGTVVAQRIAPK